MRIGREFGLALALALLVPSAGADTFDALHNKATEVDVAGNGRPDVWRKFGRNGELLSISYDNNGDGKPDEWVTFGPRRTVRQVATKFDGRIDERRTSELSADGKRTVRETLEKKEAGVWRVVEQRVYQAETDSYRVTRTPAGGKTEVTDESAKVH
jgi:hypothetical protein